MGPLAGLKIVEIAALGPAPMCAMLLADLGATVLRVERKTDPGMGIPRPHKFDLSLRNRQAIAVDLKDPVGVDFVLSLIEEADGLIEGFRPGVMERLGLGPDICQQRNGRLVYGRMTGWGQSGPLAQSAGHDVNYIAITGALSAIGRKDQLPSPPLNLVGDIGGGALYLAVGILAALLEARTSGKGQVVDTAISDCVAHMMTSFQGLQQSGLMSMERGTNIMDSGAPFYDTYECADGKLVAVGPVETKFFRQLLDLVGLPMDDVPAQGDRSHWPQMRKALAARFRERTRDQWTTLLEGTDACFAPVLTLAEAPDHPHMKAREVYFEIGGVVQPKAAPRFSRTEPAMPYAARPAADTASEDALGDWQAAGRLAEWRAMGAIS